MNSRKVTRGPLRVMRALWKVHLRVDKPVQPNRKMTCTTLWWQRVFTSTGLTEKHCWLLSKLYTLYWGRLSCIFNKEPFTFQLISKWYSPECADWMGLSKSSLPSQALYQREKWGLGRCLDLPKVTVLQRYSFHSAWSLTQHTFPSKSDTSFWRQKPTWGNSSECYPLNHSFTPNPNLSVSTDDKLFLPQRAHSFFTLFIFQVFYPMFCFRADYTQRLRLYCQYFI